MTKGKGGKRKSKPNPQDTGKRELILKEPGQEYAIITKILGDSRAEVYCFDGKTRLAHFRGAFRKRVWISRDDIVLLGLRDYEDAKCDVIHKYLPHEIRYLKNHGEVPDKIMRDLEEAEALIEFEEAEKEENVSLETL